MAKCESVRALSRQIFVAPLRWRVMPTVSVLFPSPHLFAASYVASTPSLALFLSLFRPPQHVVILHVRMYHAHAGMKVCAT